MDYLKIFFLVVLLIILFIFVFLYLVSIINSIRYKVPQVGTFASDFKVLKKGLAAYNLKGKTIADLGSGSGRVLRFFEKEFGMLTIGYEIDLSNVIYAKFLNVILKSKSKIIKGNYLKLDLSSYDVFYIYGFTILMPGIEKKLWENCKKGTLIISNAFSMPNKEPIEILLDEKGKEEVYIYKI